MDLEELRREIQQQLRDPSIEQSITGWLNQAVEEIAASFELPALRLKTPATLITTTSDYVYDVADCSHPQGYEYMKSIFRISSAAMQYGFGLEEDPTWIDSMDPDHEMTGDSVQRVVLDGGTITTWPTANDTLHLWFYRRPLEMEQGNDEPDGIPPEYHWRVLVPFVILRAYRNYPDFPTSTPGNETRSLALWTQRYNEGLYGGASTTMVGLVPYLLKQNRPYGIRVRGPARGSSLGGRW